MSLNQSAVRLLEVPQTPISAPQVPFTVLESAHLSNTNSQIISKEAVTPSKQKVKSQPYAKYFTNSVLMKDHIMKREFSSRNLT